MVYFETNRLIIRDYIEEDLFDLYQLLGDSMAMKFTMDLYVESIEGARENLNYAMTHASSRPRSVFFFAVLEKATGRYIGSCGFNEIEDSRTDTIASVEMGYFYMPEFWGRGYGTEAAKALIDYMIEHTAYMRITAGCAATNTASIKILNAAGLSLIRVLPDHQKIQDQVVDRHIFERSITRD